jgi:hypothetical protein
MGKNHCSDGKMGEFFAEKRVFRVWMPRRDLDAIARPAYVSVNSDMRKIEDKLLQIREIIFLAGW